MLDSMIKTREHKCEEDSKAQVKQIRARQTVMQAGKHTMAGSEVNQET